MELSTITIPEFFSGKNIFITGATGFLGKALIEKCLRSIPDIGNIYILMRPKRGKNLEDRLKVLIDDAVFGRLKTEQPSIKMDEKIIPLAGNMFDLNLGLNDEDRQKLTDNVNIIFHAAASVKFDDTLTYSTILNIRGTREVCQLALDCKNLITYIHVSTAYSNCDSFHIKEVLYPAKANWKNLIHIAETCDTYTLSAVTEIFTNHMPNTYVFTKQVAETVVADMLTGKVPTKLFRPSIVCSAFKEPLLGWVDNFNGPVGIIVGYGKGIMRTACISEDVILDYIPIDIVTKSLIVSTWDLAIRQNKNEIEVLHCANNRKAEWLNIVVKDISNIAGDISDELPVNNILWPLTRGYATNKYMFYIELILYMLIPSLLIDPLMKLVGMKPILKKLVLKMYNVTMALLYFSQNNFFLENERLFELLKKIKPEDMDNWDYEYRDFDKKQYLYNSILGCRRYLLKETDDTIPQAKIHFQRMKVVEKIVWYFIYILFVYFLWNILNKYIAL